MHLSRRSGPVSRGFGPSGPGLYAARVAIFKRVSRFSPQGAVARPDARPYLGRQMSGSAPERLRLGVNIDHVATVRNARGSGYPDPVRAALLAAQAGADGITAHLREDRRHITDEDIARLSAELPIPLNLEMAATDEMLEIALRHRPHAACIVPEKREERTTEGGLDAAGQHNHLAPMVRALGAANIRVSLFIEPDPRQIEAALSLGAPVVEIHTGRYCELEGEERTTELRRIADAAALAAKNGIEAHAGHGLTFDNVVPIAAIPQIRELNIGHFLIGEAIFDGLAPVVRRMRALMDEAR
jgi:pyridoxine 5-phosphate synthase